MFGDSLVNVSQHVLNNRYSLLPYYYTLFYNVHTQGGSVFRALFFEFPEQYASGIGDIDTQFMVGSALLVSPVVTVNTTQKQAYFAPGYWYDYWTGQVTSNDTTKSQTLTLDAPLSHINVHIRYVFLIRITFIVVATLFHANNQPWCCLKHARIHLNCSLRLHQM